MNDRVQRCLAIDANNDDTARKDCAKSDGADGLSSIDSSLFMRNEKLVRQRDGLTVVERIQRERELNKLLDTLVAEMETIDAEMVRLREINHD